MQPSEIVRAKTVGAKNELRRIAQDARAKVVELLELRVYINRPFRKQVDISKLLTAIDEIVEDVIIAAAHESRPHCEHLAARDLVKDGPQ